MSEVTVVPGGSKRAIDRSKYRDTVRKMIYDEVPLLQIHKWLNAQGEEITKDLYYQTVLAYAKAERDSIIVEYENKKQEEREDRKWQRKRNDAIDLCDEIIDKARNINWESISEKDKIKLALEAGKIRNVLVKDEPPAEDGVPVGFMDEDLQQFARLLGNTLARGKGSSPEDKG